jgi:hypothetical protein
MSSVTVEKIRRQSCRRPALGHAGLAPSAMTQPLFPHFHSVSGSFDALPLVMVGQNPENPSSGNCDGISNACTTRNMRSQGSSFRRGRSSLDFSPLTAESLLYDSDTPATDPWLQLFVSEYHQNQEMELASPTSTQSIGASDESSSAPHHTSVPSARTGRSDKNDYSTTTVHPGPLAQGQDGCALDEENDEPLAVNFSEDSN